MRDPRLAPFRLPLAAFALFTALQAASGAVLFATKLGLRPGQLAAYYRGAEESFRAPRTLAGILEVAIPHLLAVPLVLLVTLHLVGLAGLVRRRPFALLAGVSFACALAGIAAAFGIRWVWPGLSWLKLAAFLGLEASLAVWLLLLGSLFLPPRRPAAAGEPAPPPAREDGPAGAVALRAWAGRSGLAGAATARPGPGSRP